MSTIRRLLRPLLVLVSLAGCASLRAPIAPGGRVTTAQGVKVELPDLWAERDLVVVFFRGFW